MGEQGASPVASLIGTGISQRQKTHLSFKSQAQGHHPKNTKLNLSLQRKQLVLQLLQTQSLPFSLMTMNRASQKVLNSILIE